MNFKDFRDLGGKTLLSTISLPQLLSLVYPEVQFDFTSKTASYKKAQHALKSMLKTMFPQEGFDFVVIYGNTIRNVGRV
jgi:hypothetical protein